MIIASVFSAYLRNGCAQGKCSFLLSSTLKFDSIDEDLIMPDIHPSQISKLLKEDLLNILPVCNQLQDVGEVSLFFQGIRRILSFKLFRFTNVHL